MSGTELGLTEFQTGAGDAWGGEQQDCEARQLAKGKKKKEAADKAGTQSNRSATGIHVLRRGLRKLRTILGYVAAGLTLIVTTAIALFAFVNPPFTSVIAIEFFRLGSVDREWVQIETVPDHFPQSLVAAEDADFCLHWGFDLDAIRSAASAGYNSGGSSISQQTAKNLFLWPGRSWLRKILEVPITLLVEAFWTKQRIIEVYMNIIEYDVGVFGVAEAARQHFGKEPNELTEVESARLATIVPNPGQRNPFELPPDLEKRVAMIQDGAQTIRKDGRSSCFDVRINAKNS
ncbi:MAG: monofunctional biosynthetic peptidoglycan transglycosylase [Rhodobacteraceae bacterium]|nr:monofunctional biosynthetic peptidoglycan transglycosylase [Paracoccaceae bacterium]